MTLPVVLGVSLAVFALGIYGVLAKRDILRIAIGGTLMLSAVTLLLVALAQALPQQGMATVQAFVLVVWAVEAVEAIVAIALFLYLARKGITDIDELRELKW